MAWIAASSVPLPEESMNFSAITCAVQFTPTTPTPLLPDAAMIPAVWVPWP